MLPPGHIAAGYLTGYAFLKIFNPAIAPIDAQHLIMWTTFFGFAPDLDYFFSFIRERAFVVRNAEKNNHRKYYSHAPILWLVSGLIIYFFSTSPFYKIFGLSLWLGSWSHFLLDSVEYGIMWFWPFSSKLITFKKVELAEINKSGFREYWLEAVLQYTKSISFYLEVLIIILALIIYFR